MSVHAHISQLEKRHAQLEDAIKVAHVHHAPDDEVIKMKRNRLRIKEEIMRLRRAETSFGDSQVQSAA